MSEITEEESAKKSWILGWRKERLKSKLALSIRPAQIGSRMMNWFGREKMSSALKKLS